MTTITNSAAVASEALPPDAQLMQLVAGAFVSSALYVAAKLGIADLLQFRPSIVRRACLNYRNG